MSTNAWPRFRVAVIAILVLLPVQFIFGMLANLYVAIPETMPTGEGWTWSFAHSAVIPVHVLLGSLLLVLSLVAIELALWASIRRATLVAIGGFLCIATAYVGGMWFLTYGQTNASSFLMALGFMGACVVYGVGLYVTRPERTS